MTRLILLSLMTLECLLASARSQPPDGKKDVKPEKFPAPPVGYDTRRDDIARAHRASSAWVAARAPDGTLVATARAVSDGVKYGYIGDVAVHPDWRAKGVGDAVMRLLLDHPALRGASRVELATRDAMAFYARMGFVVVAQEDVGTHLRTTMARVRATKTMAP